MLQFKALQSESRLNNERNINTSIKNMILGGGVKMAEE